jgi:CDP-diacylglycerol--glycerol-3-phosphate 3-phosphatidyltransferase
MLVEYGKIPAWIPVIVLSREFLVSGYRLIAVQQSGAVIAASIWGKLKTVTQMIAIILIFVDKYNFFDFVLNNSGMSTFAIVFNAITSILLAISTIATIFSGYDYLKGGKELFKNAN